MNVKRAWTNAKARSNRNLNQLRRNAAKQDRLDPALQPRPTLNYEGPVVVEMPLELMADADVTLALDDLRSTFGRHGADAVETMIFGAVARWHSRGAGRLYHPQAAMIGVDASYRIMGKPELIPTWPADKQAHYRREASHALEAWSYAGSPGLKEAIETSADWLLARIKQDEPNSETHA